MTIRTLFGIILKLFGIVFFKDILQSLSNLFLTISYLTTQEGFGSLVMTGFISVVYLSASYLLIFRTNFVIDKFALDKGFDEAPLSLDIQPSTVLGIAVIVIGGVTVINEIPVLCRYAYTYFLEKQMIYGRTDLNVTSTIIEATIKMVIGLLLIGYYRQIAALIERQQKN